MSEINLMMMLITSASMDWIQVDETLWDYRRHRLKATYMTRLQSRIPILRLFFSETWIGNISAVHGHG